LPIVNLTSVAPGPFDGKVGAITKDGEYFVTSPTETHIPAPPIDDVRPVYLRADSRYGDGDPILWPQPYMAYNCHFGAIRRPNTLPQHNIMWWTPTDENFTLFEPSASPISGFGKLSPAILAHLSTSVTILLNRIKQYQRVTPEERQPPTLSPHAKFLEHSLAQLQTLYVTYPQTEFLVRDLQRVWLQLWALIDYMEIFKPRMDGRAPPAFEVANTVGIFTYDVQVAQDFFTAGLPFWFIRTSAEFTDQNIHNVVDLLHPEDHLNLNPHRFPHPLIFTGPPSSLDKYRAINQYSRNFLSLTNLFGGSSAGQGPRPSASASLFSLPPVPSVAGPSRPSAPVYSGPPHRRQKQGRSVGPRNTGETGWHLLSYSLLTII
jgi:hypothetical protein